MLTIRVLRHVRPRRFTCLYTTPATTPYLDSARKPYAPPRPATPSPSSSFAPAPPPHIPVVPQPEQPLVSEDGEPLTHYAVTQTRSAWGLPKRYKATLYALGLHRRLQTVFHRHDGVTAGKILRVKELVSVKNVPQSAVRTKPEMRTERKAPRGYVVVRRAGVAS